MAHVGGGGVENWSLWDIGWSLVGFRNAWTAPLVPHWPIAVQRWRIQVGKKWLPAAGVYYKTSLT